MRKFTVGSLFAGIGGIDLGFERAGFKTAWQVEIDPFCRKVLAKHFPHAERFEDVRNVGGHNLSPVDVIVGGFPCQDISNAGKRAGITGERSGLWAEYARIVRELRPRIVFIENVSALVGLGLDRVLCDLAALRFNATWEVVPASAVGADHHRERVWVSAYTQGEPLLELPETPVLTNSECFGQPRPRKRWSSLDNAESPYREASGFVNAFREGALPYVCGRHHGVSSSMDRLRGLGNAVVPQIPELFAHRIRTALEAAYG